VDDPTWRVARALSYVCQQLDPIRITLQSDDGGDASLLLSLVDAVKQGDDEATRERLDLLHAALRRAGDALGVYGQHDRVLRPVGLDDGPLELFYRCPLDRCSGRGWSAATAEPVRCNISGQDLRRERM